VAKIGEIGVDTPSGVVKLPVFDAGDSGSSVYEMVRVETPSGVGFVPMVATGSGTFPYVRVQTASHGVLEAHDQASLATSYPGEVLDDFDDGNWLGSRDDFNTRSFETTTPGSSSHGSVTTRPVWDYSKGSGQISVVGNDYLEITETNANEQIAAVDQTAATGEWEARFYLTGADTFSHPHWFITTTTKTSRNDGYAVQTENDGDNSKLRRWGSGGIDADLITGGLGTENSWYTERVTRNGSYQFEWFQDGSSQGTTTDSTYTTSDYMLLSANKAGGVGYDLRCDWVKVF